MGTGPTLKKYLGACYLAGLYSILQWTPEGPTKPYSLKVYFNTFCASSTMIHQTRFYVMILSVLQPRRPGRLAAGAFMFNFILKSAAAISSMARPARSL